MEDGPADVSPTLDKSELKEAIALPAQQASSLQRPLNLGTLDTSVDLVVCGKFLSFTGGSILYCLSAMCVVYGIATILGPVFARSYGLVETLPCIACLNVYEIALLAVLLVIVLWQNVTDDAISLLVLVAIFLVVSGIALTTISNSQPRSVLLIGACCFVLAMGKLFVLRRFIGVSISLALWIGLAVVLGWNFLAGARFADATTIEIVGRQEWLVSWLVLLTGGIIVLLDVAFRRSGSADASDVRVPFLRRPVMIWIFALILLVATGVHQRALAYVFDVRSDLVDYLPLVSIVSLCLLHVALRLRSKPGYFEACLAAVPLAVFLCALREDLVLDKPTLGIQLLWYPPVFLGLTGIAVLLTGLRRKCRPLLAVVPFYAVGVVLTMTFSDATSADLHWRLSGALLVSGLLLVGILRRSAALCILAVIVGTAGFSTTEAFQTFANFLNLSRVGAVVGLAGVGTLIVAFFFGRMSSAFLVLAALGVMLCTFDFLPTELGMEDLFAGLAVLALSVGLWLRLNHWPAIVILCVPVTYRLVVAPALLPAWRYVLFGFLLLFAGALVSIRKGKRARREAAPAEHGDADPPSPVDAPTSEE